MIDVGHDGELIDEIDRHRRERLPSTASHLRTDRSNGCWNSVNRLHRVAENIDWNKRWEVPEDIDESDPGDRSVACKQALLALVKTRVQVLNVPLVQLSDQRVLSWRLDPQIVKLAHTPLASNRGRAEKTASGRPRGDAHRDLDALDVWVISAIGLQLDSWRWDDRLPGTHLTGLPRPDELSKISHEHLPPRD